jgi:hypothetical protein
MSVAVGQHLADGAGDAWWFLDTRMTIKADARQTGGAYTLLEFSAPTGFGPPLHLHNEDDEGFSCSTERCMWSAVTTRGRWSREASYSCRVAYPTRSS